MLPPVASLISSTTIASAPTITPPLDGLYFYVSGITNIGTINTNGRGIGAVLNLIFLASCPITNNTTSLIFKDKVNSEVYTTSAYECVTFMVVGVNQVREIQSRFMPLQPGTISSTQTLLYANRTLNVSGSITVTVPTAVGRVSEEVWFDKTDSASTNVFITSAGGTLGGRTSIKLNAQGSVLGLRSNGTNWDVIVHRNQGTVLFAYGATITPDMAFFDAVTGGTIEVGTLAGNITMAAPLNPVDGQLLTLILIQDATGGRTVAWNAAYAFNTTFPSPTLSAATKIDEITFRYRASTSKWICVGVALGS